MVHWFIDLTWPNLPDIKPLAVVPPYEAVLVTLSVVNTSPTWQVLAVLKTIQHYGLTTALLLHFIIPSTLFQWWWYTPRGVRPVSVERRKVISALNISWWASGSGCDDWIWDFSKHVLQNGDFELWEIHIWVLPLVTVRHSIGVLHTSIYKAKRFIDSLTWPLQKKILIAINVRIV